MSKPRIIDFGFDGPLSDSELFNRVIRGSAVRRFWDIVILFAIKDGAEEVRYEPRRSERTLTYKIDGVEYELVPPPPSEATSILEEVRNLARPVGVGRSLVGMLSGLAGRLKAPSLPLTPFRVKVGGELVAVDVSIRALGPPESFALRLGASPAVLDLGPQRVELGESVVLRLGPNPAASVNAEALLKRYFEACDARRGVWDEELDSGGSD